MKITKSQLKHIIKEEFSGIIKGGPRSLLVTVLTARMQEEKDRLERVLPNSNVSNDEWRAAVDIARDTVYPADEREPSSQSSSWLDAPPTMRPSQKPFRVTDRGETPTLEEIKKALYEEFDPSKPGSLAALEPVIDRSAASIIDDIESEAQDNPGLQKTILQVLISKLQGIADK